MAKFYTHSFSEETGEHVFAFGNGAKLVVSTADLSSVMVGLLAEHGLKQKIIDSWAGCSKTQDFAGAIAKGTRVWEALLAGEWRLAASGGTDLAKAFAEAMDITEEDASEAIAKMDDEQVKKITSSPAIRKLIARYKLERLEAAGGDDDLDSLRDLLK